jgi:hypothetical protein
MQTRSARTTDCRSASTGSFGKRCRKIFRIARRTPGPLAIAVQHHKNEDQIPDEYVALWDGLRSNTSLVQIENAANWTMASKRMETQARFGDLLIALGGRKACCSSPICTTTPENRSSRWIFRFALRTLERGGSSRTDSRATNESALSDHQRQFARLDQPHLFPFTAEHC